MILHKLNPTVATKPADQLRHVLLPVILLHGYTAVHIALWVIVGKYKLWEGSDGSLSVLKAAQWPQRNITYEKATKNTKSEGHLLNRAPLAFSVSSDAFISYQN